MRCILYWTNGSTYLSTSLTVQIVNDDDIFEDNDQIQNRFDHYKEIPDRRRLNVKCAGAIDVKMDQFPQDLHIYFRSLVQLNFSNCGFKKITRNDFKFMENLRKISFTNMEIEELQGKKMFY